MKRKKLVEKKVEDVVGVVCNICGEDIPHGECGPEYATLKASWGYGSPKDTQQHEAHICEPCYDEKIVPLFKVSHITFGGC